MIQNQSYRLHLSSQLQGQASVVPSQSTYIPKKLHTFNTHDQKFNLCHLMGTSLNDLTQLPSTDQQCQHGAPHELVYPTKDPPPKPDTRYLHPASLDTHFPSWPSRATSSFPLHQMQSIQITAWVVPEQLLLFSKTGLVWLEFFFLLNWRFFCF